MLIFFFFRDKEFKSHTDVNNPINPIVPTDSNVIIVDKEINLQGRKWYLPENSTLLLKGGIIKEGSVIGWNTKINGKDAVFNKVKIEGSWNVPVISSSLFVDLNYVNSLRDVVALSNPALNNKIIINEGFYAVSADKEKDACILLTSNTDLVLDGTIQLKPNAFKSCYIIRAEGNNINIRGKGTVIGDKHTHTGKDGEWGMGIFLRESNNVTINGLTIKNCWGDCIYIGGNSRNVVVENCQLEHGRRQGISITSADSVAIKGCKISNVGGTNPQYAIDLEPNSNCVVDHVMIDNVNITDCKGGICATIGKVTAGKKQVGRVSITNSYISAQTKYPVRFVCCDSVSISNCTIIDNPKLSAIYSLKSDIIVIKDNIIYCHKKGNADILEMLRGSVEKNDNPIEIVNSNSQTIVGNTVLEME